MKSGMLKPVDVAERLGVKVDVVRGWIATGQLRAMDVSAKPGGRRRYRIDPTELAALEARRSVRSGDTTRRGRRRRDDGIIEFF